MFKKLLFVGLTFVLGNQNFAQENLNEEFLKAANWGKLDEVKTLITKGADINATNAQGNSAGVMALYNYSDDNGAMMEYLLNNGLDVKLKTKDGNNFLHVAADNEATGIIPTLVQKGLPLDEKNSRGQTAVFIAARNGDFKTVNSLVKLGANPNIPCNEELVVEQYDLEDEEQWNDLMSFPLEKNSLSFLIIEAIYDLESAEKVQQLITKGAPLDILDEDGASLLHLAAELEESDVLITLLNAGIDPNILNEEGENALWAAENTENAKVLISKGTDVNQVVGDASLLSAHIYYGLPDFVFLFIASGADVYYKVDGQSLTKYCKALLKLEKREGVQYATEELAKENLEDWKKRVETCMEYLKQNGVK